MRVHIARENERTGDTMNTLEAIARTLTGAPDVRIPREVKSAINKALHAHGRDTLGSRNTVAEVRAYLREDEVAHAPTREPQQVIAYQGFAHAVPTREPAKEPCGAELRSTDERTCARKVEAGTRCHDHAGVSDAEIVAQREEDARKREAYLARKEALAIFADLHA